MGKSSDTSSKTCTEIQTLILHTLKSQREIAAITGISKSVVNRIKKKIDGNLLLETNRIGKCGRERMTTFRGDRHIRETCLRIRKMCVAHITRIIKQDGINVSQRTVQRRLAEENFIARRECENHA